MRLANYSPRKSLSVDPDALFRELLKRTRDGFPVPSLDGSRRKRELDRRKNQCDDGPMLYGLTLVKWQIVVRHRQHSGVNGRGIDWAHPAAPTGVPTVNIAFLLDTLHHGGGNGLVPFLPSIATDHVLRRGRVEIAIHIPLLRFPVVGEQVLGSLHDQRIIV